MTATLLAAVSAASAATQKQSYTTPTAILKQIDKHNEDGSYTYGYEAADGTYKIETKYPDGEVYGKYGYTDDTGTLREVEYGASKRGFEPTGNEIQVPPPTLKVNENAIARPLAPNEIDDGQYREDPSVYYQDETYNNQQDGGYQRPASRYQSYQQTPSYQTAAEPENDFEIEAFKPSYKPQSHKQPAYRPQTTYTQADYRPQPSIRPQPSYRPQSVYRPQTSYRQEPEYYEPEPEYRTEPPRYRPQPSYPKSNFGFSNSNNNNNWNPPPPPPPPPQPTYNNWNNQNTGPSWNGHPASNVDIWTGSYSVNYKR